MLTSSKIFLFGSWKVGVELELLPVDLGLSWLMSHQEGTLVKKMAQLIRVTWLWLETLLIQKNNNFTHEDECHEHVVS